MPDERIDNYLRGIDAAADWTPEGGDGHAPGFDEWNALRMAQGQRRGTFGQYLREIAPRLAEGDDMADEETN